MSGVLHPVGPEPEQTYWIRRILVLGSAALLLVLLVALVVNATSAGSASAAAPPPLVAPAGASTSPSPSASPTTSSKAKASTAAKPTASPSAQKTTEKAAEKTKASEKTAKTKPAGPVACAPGQLRTTLTGKQRLKRKQHVALRLSLINGTGATCTVKVSPATFTLTIYSGRDRIYSTADCASAVKPLTKKVADEAAVAWSMSWNGRRSAKSCHNRPEIPRAGTYKATAKLDGSKPVTMRIIIRA